MGKVEGSQESYTSEKRAMRENSMFHLRVRNERSREDFHEREMPRERQADRQTGRNRVRQADRQTEMNLAMFITRRIQADWSLYGSLNTDATVGTMYVQPLQ